MYTLHTHPIVSIISAGKRSTASGCEGSKLHIRKYPSSSLRVEAGSGESCYTTVWVMKIYIWILQVMTSSSTMYSATHTFCYGIQFTPIVGYGYICDRRFLTSSVHINNKEWLVMHAATKIDCDRCFLTSPVHIAAFLLTKWMAMHAQQDRLAAGFLPPTL